MWNTKWKGACAESIGPLHIKQKLPMQDSHYLFLSKKCFIAAVSDGLGSKAHSDFGSKTACCLFVKLAKEWIGVRDKSPEDFTSLFVKKWVCEIQKSSFDVRDCSATFLGAVYHNSTLYLFQLGDGMISCIFDDESKNLVMTDAKEESFSNMTKSLRNEVLPNDWIIRTISAEDLKSVFLCSDGISDDLQKGADVAFVSELTEQYLSKSSNKIKHDMKNWISHWPVPRHSDDKTAVFVCRKDRA